MPSRTVQTMFFELRYSHEYRNKLKRLKINGVPLSKIDSFLIHILAAQEFLNFWRSESRVSYYKQFLVKIRVPASHGTMFLKEEFRKE